MTTDMVSTYIVFSGPLDKLMPEAHRREYYETDHLWFPRRVCEEHKMDFVDTRCKGDVRSDEGQPCCTSVQHYDQRTPGLFKEEFSGDGMVVLNSETYYCWRKQDANKYSSKGLSMITNTLNKGHFMTMVMVKKSIFGKNRSFVKKDGMCRIYEHVACFHSNRNKRMVWAQWLWTCKQQAGVVSCLVVCTPTGELGHPEDKVFQKLW